MDSINRMCERMTNFRKEAQLSGSPQIIKEAALLNAEIMRLKKHYDSGMSVAEDTFCIIQRFEILKRLIAESEKK